jgi:hypothetical protein
MHIELACSQFGHYSVQSLTGILRGEKLRFHSLVETLSGKAAAAPPLTVRRTTSGRLFPLSTPEKELSPESSTNFSPLISLPSEPAAYPRAPGWLLRHAVVEIGGKEMHNLCPA